MATTEDSPAPAPANPAPPALPDYPKMVMEAIEALNETGGSNKTSIAQQIESTHSDLPPAHTTLLRIIEGALEPDDVGAGVEDHVEVIGGRADVDADAGEVLAVALGEARDDGGAKPGGGWAGSGAVVGEGGEGVEAEGVTAEAEVEELGVSAANAKEAL
ncbi:hypothetical protein ACLB2K_011990 [Fragaria x ananassa]